MSALLFTLPIAIGPSNRRGLKVSARRPKRPPICSSNPNLPSDASDQAWKDLARSLGASDSAPPRPPPKWINQDEESTEADANAWANWQSARAEQTPIAERDPQKETDFWRAAAQELTESPQTPSLADTPVDPNASSSEIWGLARGVTGEMSELQDKLRADLDRYNPEENTDQYRRIARELVGPGDDEWETISDDAELRRPSISDNENASPASGWNPDTDWKRFDDVRREEVLKKDKEGREVVARDAQQKREEAFEKLGGEASSQDVGEITYTDETGRVLTPQEVKKAMEEGAIFVDEAGAEIRSSKDTTAGSMAENDDSYDTATNALESGKVPGFIANRYRSSGTYGSAYSGAEEQIRELQQQGVPLRDPKADTESWRDAARELNIDVESDPIDTGDKESDAISTDSTETDDSANQSSELGDDFVNDVDSSSSWKTWRRGSVSWEEAAANTAPRDPKQEVDMWRASARELAAGVEQDSPRAASPTAAGNGGASNDSKAWNVWRDANTKWESSLKDTNENLGNQNDRNPWSTENVKADWGTGLNSRASSDRSAWENWNKVKGGMVDSGKRFWWSTAGSPSTGKENNSERWRDAASELVGNGDISGNSKKEGPQAVQKDEILEFWKTVAKDIEPTGNSSNASTDIGKEG